MIDWVNIFATLMTGSFGLAFKHQRDRQLHDRLTAIEKREMKRDERLAHLIMLLADKDMKGPHDQ